MAEMTYFVKRFLLELTFLVKLSLGPFNIVQIFSLVSAYMFLQYAGDNF